MQHAVMRAAEAEFGERVVGDRPRNRDRRRTDSSIRSQIGSPSGRAGAAILEGRVGRVSEVTVMRSDRVVIMSAILTYFRTDCYRKSALQRNRSCPFGTGGGHCAGSVRARMGRDNISGIGARQAKSGLAEAYGPAERLFAEEEDDVRPLRPIARHDLVRRQARARVRRPRSTCSRTACIMRAACSRASAPMAATSSSAPSIPSG